MHDVHFQQWNFLQNGIFQKFNYKFWNRRKNSTTEMWGNHTYTTVEFCEAVAFTSDFKTGHLVIATAHPKLVLKYHLRQAGLWFCRVQWSTVGRRTSRAVIAEITLEPSTWNFAGYLHCTSATKATCKVAENLKSHGKTHILSFFH